MNDENLSKLSLAELYELLSSSTQQLLDAIGDKSDGVTLKTLQEKVETIHAVIKTKKQAEENKH